MLSSLSHNDTDTSAYTNIIDIDANLVHDVQRDGDRAAFTRLMNKYKNTIFSFCFRYTGNRQDAEDVSQDVFIKVFKSIGSFRGDSKFSTWLYRLTVNTCLNHVRWLAMKRIKEMVRIHGDEKEEPGGPLKIPDASADPERMLLNEELGSIIHKAVTQLKDKQRSVLILKDFQDKSYEEIAAIMHMNPGTVKSTLSRGRLNAAKQIKEYVRP